MKKKTRNLLIIALLLFTSFFILTNSGLLPFSIVDVSGGQDVYVPVYGQAKCVPAQTANASITTNRSFVSFKEQDIGNIITLQKMKDNGVSPTTTTSVCPGINCTTTLGGVVDDIKYNVKCDSGYLPVWQLRTGSTVLGFNQYEFKDIDPSYQVNYQWVETKTGNITTSKVQAYPLVDNSSMTFESACYKPAQFLTNPYLANSSYHNYYYQYQTKKIEYTTLDGQYLDQASGGCSSVQLNDLVNRRATNPVDGTVVYYDTSVKDGSKTEVVKPVPSQLNLYDTFQFFYQWKKIDTLNLVRDDVTGKTFYVDRQENRVYNVTFENITNGNPVPIASSVEKENPECTSTAQCVNSGSFGAGYQCVYPSFTCEKQEAYCSIVQPCPSTEYSTSSSGQIVKTNYSCVNNSCAANSTNVVCDPTTSSPANGCPSDRSICSLDGSSCSAPVPTLSQCPASSTGCCPASSVYFEKSCQAGYVCDAKGGLVGNCVPLNYSSCDVAFNNGVCDNGAQGTLDCDEDVRDTQYFSPSDCGSSISIYDLCRAKNDYADGVFILGYGVVEHSGVSVWNLFGLLGSDNTLSCDPTYNMPLFIGLIVIFGVVVVGLFVFQPFSKKGKGRRR